eukprot:447623-Rhodomonas_salina.2
MWRAGRPVQSVRWCEAGNGKTCANNFAVDLHQDCVVLEWISGSTSTFFLAPHSQDHLCPTCTRGVSFWSA